MASKDKIPVVEIFGPTIMGEGILIGMPTWFIRTAACDYNETCMKCDSMHAVDPHRYTGIAKQMTSMEIVSDLIERMGNCEWVTISGGNPVLWNLEDVVLGLQGAGKNVCLETQGSIFKTWVTLCDVVHIAPKGPGMVADANKSFEVLEGFMDRYMRCLDTEKTITCIKIPIFESADLDFAEHVTEAWPMFNMTLSCGNDDPPVSEATDVGINYLRSSLLIRLGKIVEEVLKRPKLMHATILPQLHVLLYGNKQGV